MLLFYQWLACCGKATIIHQQSALLGYCHSSFKERRTGSWEKPFCQTHTLNCDRIRIKRSWSSSSQVLLLPFICVFSSFCTAADFLGFVFLAVVVFFVPEVQNCFVPSLITSPSSRSLISHLGSVDPFSFPEFSTIKIDYYCTGPCMFWAEIMTYQ